MKKSAHLHKGIGLIIIGVLILLSIFQIISGDHLLIGIAVVSILLGVNHLDQYRQAKE
ncbi:MAG TPA: hypothetical protein VGT41_01055 [Candidatus Babeliales bacterium]|nr:hypothetical protein [Candidatus Babeliales bacterium]